MIARLLCALAYRRFRAACADPLRSQAAQLRRILRQAEGTAAGRRYGFRALRGIADDARLVRAYQDAVPVRTYAAMRADLDAVYAGDWRRLCPSPPIFFAMTAGSTGAFKFIPVTREFRRELWRGSLAFQGAVEACLPEVRALKTQFLVGSAEGGRSPAGVPQGFVSGFNYGHLPWIVRRRFVVPYWVFTLPDAEERAYAAGRILVSERRLGLLCAVTPLNLVNLRQALDRHAERLCGDVARGTLTVRGAPAVPGGFHTRPDPALAEALRAAWQREGKLPTALLFPALRVLVCWQGGNMSYYLDGLDEAFGLDRHFEFPISASEGVFAIPHRAGRAGGALAITSHFLEFLPEEPAGAAAPRALRADELVAGAEYRLVVTNGGGCYRYDMEDVVRVTGFLGRTPVIEFVSKTDRRVSVANERLTELDVTVAMRDAGRACGARFGGFLFVPCSDRRYRVVVDGADVASHGGPVPDAALTGLAVELERQLRVAAKGYDFEREDALLGPLELVVTDPGELAAHLRWRQGDQRLPNAQVKPVHLATTFDLHASFTTVRTYAA